MITEIDIRILKFLESLRSDVFNIIFKYITTLGEGPFAILVIACFYFLFNKEFGKKMLYVYGIGSHINNTIKIFVNRIRPFRLDNGVTCVYPKTATGYAFPSGHSESIASLETLLMIKFKKIWGYIFGIFLILLVGFSRLYLGAHYPSDVICGIIIGMISAMVLSRIYDKFDEKQLWFFSIIIFIPALVFAILKQDVHYLDFFKTYGLIIGCGLGCVIESKYVKFKLEDKKIKRVFRLVISAIPALICYFVPKLVLDTTYYHIYLQDFIAFIRYFAMAIFLVGLGPLIYKKLFDK